MKKYIILLFLFISAGLFSCSDLLDLQPDGRTTMDEVFTTRPGVQGYLNSCYAAIPSQTYQRSALCDDAIDSDGILANSVYNLWYGNAFSAASYKNIDNSPWDSYYQGIRKCNLFLANMVNVTTSSFVVTEEELTAWVAHAHALRALYYLQLIKRYGAVPLITQLYDITHDYGTDTKASVSEIVTQILSDCDEALSTPSLGWHPTTGQKGVMTRAVAYAVISQAVTLAASPLFADGVYTWADATLINKEALSECLANGYQLFDETPLPNIAQNAYALYFITRPDELQAYDKETIYGGSVVEIWRSAGMPSTPGQTTAGSCPTQELVDCYEMQATGEPPILGYSDAQHLNPIPNPASGYDADNPYAGRDSRFYATVYYNGAARRLDGQAGTVNTATGTDGISTVDRRTTHTGYYLRKYHNWQSGRDNNADGAVRLFRLAELYLNFAESAYLSDGPDVPVNMGNGLTMSARDAVNAIRSRAAMPPFPAGLSKADFEKKYRNERRVEFAFEEVRYFDVRRWQILPETERYTTGMLITENGSGGFNYTRIGFERGSYLNKYYFYPIPQPEVNKMQDHTGTNWQNPDWN
jgi:hypothetical protein